MEINYYYYLLLLKYFMRLVIFNAYCIQKNRMHPVGKGNPKRFKYSGFSTVNSGFLLLYWYLRENSFHISVCKTVNFIPLHSLKMENAILSLNFHIHIIYKAQLNLQRYLTWFPPLVSEIFKIKRHHFILQTFLLAETDM